MLPFQQLAVLTNFSGTVLPVSNICAEPGSGTDSIHHAIHNPEKLSVIPKNGTGDSKPDLSPVIICNPLKTRNVYVQNKNNHRIRHSALRPCN